MKNIHNILKNSAPTVKVTVVDNIEQLTEIAPVEVTRGGNKFQLDVLQMEKGKEKGNHYFGFDITKENFTDKCTKIGFEVCAPMLHTAINTKMQSFNEQALLNVRGEKEPSIAIWDKLTPAEQYNKFTAELVKIVEAWSMREMSQKKLLEEMSALGIELATATVERRGEIMLRLAELACMSAVK